MTYTSDREAILDVLANAHEPLTATDVVWRAEHPSGLHSAWTMRIDNVEGLLGQLATDGQVGRAGTFEGQSTWTLRR